MQGYKRLSIIIPVYNEESTVKRILEKVCSAKLPVEKDIICVDDGSKDRSADIIRSFMGKHPEERITYVRKRNGGKGSAIRKGFRLAKGDIITVQDADLEYDPRDFRKMIAPILNGKCKVVYGSRYKADKKGHFRNRHVVYMIHKFGNQFLSILTSVLYGQVLTDMETCYKMFTREVYSSISRDLSQDDFRIEPEITASIMKRGFRIIEVPIRYASRDFSEGKKITWVDGLMAAVQLLKSRI